MKSKDPLENKSISSSQRQVFGMMGEIYHDQAMLENELNNMTKEDKDQLRKLLSTEKNINIVVQTMENSCDELERIYGKENVQNLLKKDR